MPGIKAFIGDYYFLSNYFDPCPVEFEGITYRNSEAAYQAQKCRYAGDRYQFAGIDPDSAKLLGRYVEIRDRWDENRVFVMRDVLRAKFDQHPELAQMLIDTGDKELVEGNDWHDNFFGDCRCPACRATPGTNYLGRLLMIERKRQKQKIEEQAKKVRKNGRKIKAFQNRMQAQGDRLQGV